MVDPNTSVASIVLDHSECAAVLARHRIDTCCIGGRTLSEACRERRLDVANVVGDLEVAIQRRSPADVDPQSMSTRQLVKQVIGRHHRYLHRTLPFLSALIAKVVRVHGEREPSLLRVRGLYDSLQALLVEHLHEEEHVLFPALLNDGAASRRGADGVAGLLHAMGADHAVVTALLVDLRSAAADYQPPSWACTGYQTLLRELSALEADTIRHLDVEDHVLRPRFQAAA